MDTLTKKPKIDISKEADRLAKAQSAWIETSGKYFKGNSLHILQQIEKKSALTAALFSLKTCSKSFLLSLHLALKFCESPPSKGGLFGPSFSHLSELIKKGCQLFSVEKQTEGMRYLLEELSDFTLLFSSLFGAFLNQKGKTLLQGKEEGEKKSQAHFFHLLNFTLLLKTEALETLIQEALQEFSPFPQEKSNLTSFFTLVFLILAYLNTKNSAFEEESTLLKALQSTLIKHLEHLTQNLPTHFDPALKAQLHLLLQAASQADFSPFFLQLQEAILQKETWEKEKQEIAKLLERLQYALTTGLDDKTNKETCLIQSV